MKYIDAAGEEQDRLFINELREAGLQPRICVQCLACTLSCPLSFAMDFQPHQVVRLAALGLKKHVLNSSAIWVCASCQSCSARCPYGIDIPHLMDVLHQVALREGLPAQQPRVLAFHQVFLWCLRMLGRPYEPLLALLYGLKARHFPPGLLSQGVSLLLKGRVRLMPVIRGRKAVADIFQRIEAQQ